MLLVHNMSKDLASPPVLESHIDDTGFQPQVFHMQARVGTAMATLSSIMLLSRLQWLQGRRLSVQHQTSQT
jgi:hypothetical protein